MLRNSSKMQVHISRKFFSRVKSKVSGICVSMPISANDFERELYRLIITMLDYATSLKSFGITHDLWPICSADRKKMRSVALCNEFNIITVNYRESCLLFVPATRKSCPKFIPLIETHFH